MKKNFHEILTVSKHSHSEVCFILVISLVPAWVGSLADRPWGLGLSAACGGGGVSHPQGGDVGRPRGGVSAARRGVSAARRGGASATHRGY